MGSGPVEAPFIQVSDLRFRWGPRAPVVLDIEALEIPRGARVLLRGPSGSGKTSLLNLLGGIAVPERGSVGIAGEPLSRLPGARRDRFRADRIGFIFQMFNLLPYLSMVENVTLPCRFSRVRRVRAGDGSGPVAQTARRLLSQMGLDLAALSGRPVAELSVGQQQRVAAARALIGGPELIIADEPTSAIDPAARTAFLDLLFGEIAETGATLVFVSHETGLDAAFDRVIDLTALNRVAA